MLTRIVTLIVVIWASRALVGIARDFSKAKSEHDASIAEDTRRIANAVERAYPPTIAKNGDVKGGLIYEGGQWINCLDLRGAPAPCQPEATKMRSKSW